MIPFENFSVDTTRAIIAVIFVGLAGLLLYLFSPILTPFVVAILLAYIGDPLVDSLERHGLPRGFGVVVIFVLLLSCLALIGIVVVPLLLDQITILFERLPTYSQLARDGLSAYINDSSVRTLLPDSEELKKHIQNSLPQAGNAIAYVFSAIGASGSVIIDMVTTTVLVPIVTFYCMRDFDVITHRVRSILPNETLPFIDDVVDDANNVLGSFLWGQFLVMIALGAIYWIGLSIIGLEFAFLIGIVSGLLSFVPYVGTIVGMVLASVAIIFQTQEVTEVWKVLVVFGVGQALEGYALTPYLVGDKIGLHPVLVIFAVLAGGHLFGFVGILLALPAAAVLLVVIRHSIALYKSSQPITKDD